MPFYANMAGYLTIIERDCNLKRLRNTAVTPTLQFQECYYYYYTAWGKPLLFPDVDV